MTKMKFLWLILCIYNFSFGAFDVISRDVTSDTSTVLCTDNNQFNDGCNINCNAMESCGTMNNGNQVQIWCPKRGTCNVNCNGMLIQ